MLHRMTSAHEITEPRPSDERQGRSAQSPTVTSAINPDQHQGSSQALSGAEIMRAGRSCFAHYTTLFPKPIHHSAANALRADHIATRTETAPPKPSWASGRVVTKKRPDRSKYHRTSFRQEDHACPLAGQITNDRSGNQAEGFVNQRRNSPEPADSIAF